MWSLIGLCLVSLNMCLCDSIYFCSDMQPQPHVAIEQLMGMWYGIEIINHNSEELEQTDQWTTEREHACPVLFFAEERLPSTISPLYKDYNNQQNYGSGYGYQDRNYDNQNLGILDEDSYLQTTQSTVGTTYYPRSTKYDREYPKQTYHNRRKQFSDTALRKYNEYVRHLRLMWDENGSYTEYTMRYNVSRAGFWIMSGPQNGSSLEPEYNPFAGTIQVIKAVGNHMVLVFCHQLPDRQLYSVLLSRVPKLSQQEIHSVHSLLNRKGLSTTAVRKVCAHNGAVNIGNFNIFIMFMPFLFFVCK